MSTDPEIGAFPKVERSSWGSEIDLTVEVEGPEGDAQFSRFRGNLKNVIVAYGFDVALAKLISASRTTINGKPTWNLKLAPTKTDFTDQLEMGTSSTTADQYAERRVRRLLLDEYPMSLNSEQSDFLAVANEAMQENLIEGLNSLVKVRGSTFPILFKQLQSSPGEFLEIAWISAAANLKLSSAVEHIDQLKLSLVGNFLEVHFSGYRHRKYVNVEPYRINVSGRVSLEGAHA